MRIMVAPLHWGLGHAARCIPIIRKLLEKGAEVHLASDGDSLKLLQQEFPGLPECSLPGYRIRYAQHRRLAPTLIRQLPRLMRTFFRERQVIRRYCEEYGVHAIISDNRPGCYQRHIPSIYITHQLYIPLPGMLPRRLANFFHHRLIRHFQSCWIPDLPEPPGLAGALSHQQSPVPERYIGPLSRMTPLGTTMRYQLAIVLSGPEPQRSLLEAIILRQIEHFQGPVLLLRGLPGKAAPIKAPPHCTVFGHLPARKLNESLAASRIVLSRSGYSTIMDLSRLRKPAILIPTPGQPEQEYLARKFHREGIFLCQAQKEFDLAQALREIHRFPGLQLPESELLDIALEELLASY